MSRRYGMGLFKLLRPLNGVIGGVAVFVGGLLTHEGLCNPELLLACVVCFLIIGGGNAINDFADAEIDKTNRPKRPIPSGMCKKEEALTISIVLFVLGLLISGWLGLEMFLVALFASLLILLYNFNLKERGISGNLLVAFLGGLPFVYGGAVVKCPVLTLIPFGFAFMLHFAREILKDIEDMPGDKIVKNTSFPIKYGIKPAIWLSSLILCILIGFTFLPLLIKWYGIFYLVGVLVCIDLPIGFMIYRLFKDVAFVSKACNLLKFSMVIGLGVLALGYWR